MCHGVQPHSLKDKCISTILWDILFPVFDENEKD
jgi:hypothetical protein